VAVKEEYQIEISYMFATSENLDDSNDDVNMN
jgi:hypothetical protein